MKVEMTNFARRSFKKDSSGTKITCSEDEFMKSIHFEEHQLLDGYADFCKILPVPNNFTDTKSGSMEITLENMHYLRSGYSKRRDGELPVLSRWFEIPGDFAPSASHFMLILYSMEQLWKEHQTGPDKEYEFELSGDCDYGIVAILAQNSDAIEPMQPITMLRNALGTEEGGSGVPIDIENYNKSVDFWSKNAIVKLM